MKKSIYLLAILGTLISGCSDGSNNGNPNPNTFSFQNLKLDIPAINKIGVHINQGAILNNSNLYIETPITNSTLYSYLVGFDNQEQIVPLRYLNSSGIEIQIPFSVYSIEVQAEFSFIVYFYQGWGYPQFDYSHRNLPDELLFTNTIKSRTWQRWVILHNKSGVLIDSKDLFDDGDEIRYFQPFDERINYFTYNQERGTCRNELSFNSESSSFIVSEPTCTSLSIYPMYSHQDGGFIYQIENSGYNYSSKSMDSTRQLGFAPFVRTFKATNGNIIAITSGAKKFLTLSSNFEIIEETEISVVYEDDFWRDRSENWALTSVGFLFLFEGSYYFYVVGQQVKVDYENMDYSISNDYSGIGDFVLFDNNVFHIKNNQIMKLRDGFEYETIENSFNTINNLSSYSQTGYLSYYQVSGLTQINKYLNLQTGEIFLESEPRPTITVTQVQPIN
jgi:hypothetical protein